MNWGFKSKTERAYPPKGAAESIPMENLCLFVVGVLWSRNDDITHF